jgi:hypothetical protein
LKSRHTSMRPRSFAREGPSAAWGLLEKAPGRQVFIFVKVVDVWLLQSTANQLFSIVVYNIGRVNLDS